MKVKNLIKLLRLEKIELIHKINTLELENEVLKDELKEKIYKEVLKDKDKILSYDKQKKELRRLKQKNKDLKNQLIKRNL